VGHSVTETSPPPHHRGIRNFRVVACVLVAQESLLHLLRLLQFAQREWSPLFFLSVTFIAPRRARRARASLTPLPPSAPSAAKHTVLVKIPLAHSPAPLLSITSPPLTLTRDLDVIVPDPSNGVRLLPNTVGTFWQ
jgi:hypothetical protein